MPDDIKPEEKPEVDLAAQLADTEAKLVKMTSDRDNYRTVALAKKGKTVDGEPSESEEERIQRIVDERIQDSQISQLLKEKEEITRKAVQENTELKVALKNRGQVGATAGAAGQGAPDVKTDFFTEAQKVELQNRFKNLPIGTKGTFEDFLAQTQANLLKIKQN